MAERTTARAWTAPARSATEPRRVRLRVLRPAWAMVAEPIEPVRPGLAETARATFPFPCGSSVTRYETRSPSVRDTKMPFSPPSARFLGSEEQPGPAAGRTAEGRCECDVLIASIQYQPATAYSLESDDLAVLRPPV